MANCTLIFTGELSEHSKFFSTVNRLFRNAYAFISKKYKVYKDRHHLCLCNTPGCKATKDGLFVPINRVTRCLTHLSLYTKIDKRYLQILIGESKFLGISICKGNRDGASLFSSIGDLVSAFSISFYSFKASYIFKHKPVCTTMRALLFIEYVFL